MPQPEKRFKVRNCSASIFVNEFLTTEGKVPIRTVVLQRTFRDKEGKFQYSNSFGANDIPRAILALQKAYEYMVMDSASK